MSKTSQREAHFGVRKTIEGNVTGAKSIKAQDMGHGVSPNEPTSGGFDHECKKHAGKDIHINSKGGLF